MYRRILVPIDGSATADLGLKHAIGLAKEQGARIRMLNVIDERFFVTAGDGFATDPTPLIESLRSLGRDALANASARAQSAGVAFETAMVESVGRYVSDVILEDARKWEADLIVMGTHGRRGLNRLLLGSDAERVLRATPVPMLLVRGADASASD